jgi:poly(3-hydroxyalkanoate) synthetase
MTEPESNLVTHARRELERIGEELYAVDWFLSVIRAFAAFGHSGGSAMVTIPVLERLLRYQPLSSLTDDPDEWIDRSEIMDEPWWQNVRDPLAMSHDGGKTYWLVDSDDTTLMHHSEPVISPGR